MPASVSCVGTTSLSPSRTRRRLGPVKRVSGCVHRAPFPFQLHFRDAVIRHPHLREPGCNLVFIGSLHHADCFAFREVGKTAVTLDRRVLLRRLGELPDLLRREFARRQSMCAHKFGHDHSPPFFIVSTFRLMSENETLPPPAATKRVRPF